MRTQRRGMKVLFNFLIVSAMALPVWGGDVLTDVLREKGVISKEDWVRIDAARAYNPTAAEKKNIDGLVNLSWTKKGFWLSTDDEKWGMSLQWRFQGRLTYPERGDADTLSDFTDNPESTFELRRVRMKIGGHGYQPWIKYYFEVDLQSTTNAGRSPGSARVIDWRIDLAKFHGPRSGLGSGRSIITVSGWIPLASRRSSNVPLSTVSLPLIVR